MRLFVSTYSERKSARRTQLQACLTKNVEGRLFDLMGLLEESDDAVSVTGNLVERRRFQRRPTYQDYFQWANECVSGNDEVSVIANSDIYFDKTLLTLARCLRPNQCAALSRWDVQPDGTSRLFDRNDSQDVWVFRGKIRPIVADFCMGIPRCDNRMLYELRAAGYEVINPAFSVKVFHLHAGERGEYPGQIDGMHVDPPYAYLWPHNLLSLPATLWHRLRHPDVPLGWRFDGRKLQRSLPCRAVNRLRKR